MTAEIFPLGTVSSTWATVGGTRMVILRGGRPDAALRTVVWCSGWPYSRTSGESLIEQALMAFSPIHGLLASGRTVVVPFTGSCWGETTTFPDEGGTGRLSIGDAVTAASFLSSADSYDLVGVSHGGCVAVNWAWRDYTDLHRMWLLAPAWDLVDIYDNADAATIGWGFDSVSESMRGLYGAANRAEWLAASAGADPHRNLASIAPLADRTAAVCAVDDEVVDCAGLAADCASLGISFSSVSYGGHLFFNTAPEWTDWAPLRWLSV